MNGSIIFSILIRTVACFTLPIPEQPLRAPSAMERSFLSLHMELRHEVMGVPEYSGIKGHLKVPASIRSGGPCPDRSARGQEADYRLPEAFLNKKQTLIFIVRLIRVRPARDGFFGGAR